MFITNVLNNRKVNTSLLGYPICFVRILVERI